VFIDLNPAMLTTVRKITDKHIAVDRNNFY